jgi:uncharacterized caspase-like protein
MAKNWAIVVGINQYEFLQPLQYAQRDAQLMEQFLRAEAGFERIFFFSDNSLEIAGKSTRPFRANLLRVFREVFETPFLSNGDSFWFFFSGHGVRHADRDYLMPLDGDPRDIENTAISINYIAERLRRCGADNVLIMLDACRNSGAKTGTGIGEQTAEKARQTGVISVFSCSPSEYSYEIEALQQGAFTCALLEGLGIQGQCSTVERLNQYLEHRVPALNRQYQKPKQTPYIIAEPVTRSHLILIPRHVTLADIATLKNDAYQAEVNQDFSLAEQLWIRVLAATSGQDMEAVEALQRMEHSKLKQSRKDVSPGMGTEISDSSYSSGKKSVHLFSKRYWQVGAKFLVGLTVTAVGFEGYQIYTSINSPLNIRVVPVPPTAVSPRDNWQQMSTGEAVAAATRLLGQDQVTAAQPVIQALLYRGALNEAKAVLNPVLVKQAENPTINFLVGQLAWRAWIEGDKAYAVVDARRRWETAVKLQPNNSSYQNALGFAYYEEGKFDQASKAWLRTLQLLGKQPGTPATAGSANLGAAPEALHAYAGLALTLAKTAEKAGASNRAEKMAQARTLRQQVMTAGGIQFSPTELARDKKNWLWSEKTIQDWQALQAQ